MSNSIRTKLLENGAMTIWLSSPATRNALSTTLLEELASAIARARAPEVRVVVLRADGPSFCAGADLKAVVGGKANEILRGIVDVQRDLLTLPKPVVARVHGQVRAGGIGIVAASDVAVGASNATFAFTESRLGLAPAVIALTVTPRISPRAASEWMISGATFDGTIAAANGLLSTAVQEDALDDAVLAVSEEFLRTSPQGAAATKRMLNQSILRTYDADAESKLDLSTRLFESPLAQLAISEVWAGGRASRASMPGDSGVSSERLT